MRILYYAYTQLHIFNIINLRMSIHKDDECDLIILNPDHTGVENILSRLESAGLFDRILVVYNFRPASSGVKKAFVHLKEMWIAQNNKKRIKNFVTQYEYAAFFTFGSNLESYFAFNYINKSGNVKYCVYEEGVGTYYHTLVNMLKPWNTCFLKMNGVYIPNFPDELWVLQPAWLVNEIPDDCAVKRIPSFYNSNIINNIWNFDNGKISKSCIMLEQPISGLEQLQANVFHLVRKDKSIVKMHPRSESQSLYEDLDVMKTNNTMWEIICLNNSLYEKVLISYFSTACLSPKSLLGEEPKIIFLFKMREFNRTLSERNEKLVESFVSSYEDPSRIYMPTSIEEFKSILSELELE